MAFRFIDYDSKIRTTLDNKNVWNVLYPIGSLYFTTTDKSPAEMFPTPTDFTWRWERLSGGYLYATDGNPTGGSSGGSEKVSLQVSNLPIHNHTISHKHERGSMEITGKTPYFDEWSMPGGWGGAFRHTGNESRPNGYRSGATDTWREADFVASRTWEGQTSEPTIGVSGNTGSGEPFTIKPPYIAVFCWRRVE